MATTTEQNDTRSIRASLMSLLNLREGDSYEITLTAGGVKSIKLSDVVWSGTEIMAIRVDTEYLARPLVHSTYSESSMVDHKSEPIQTKTVEIIPWDAIDSIVWHKHWQEEK